MNKVILMGRLTRDPDVRYSQSADSSMAIASYTLAVDRKYKQNGQPTADFINCKAIGKNGEFAERYLRQGTKIVVEGHIQTGSYTHKDGHKVYTTEVMVDGHEFAESKNAAAENGIMPPPNMDTSGFMSMPDNIDDEGLPFN